MCFYVDCEWYAEIVRETTGPERTPATCVECGAPIAAGEWRRHVEQQEHEECQVCIDWGDEQIRCDGAHDYGETYACDFCRRCDQLLRAIEEVETAEGCPPDARRPAYGELWEEMAEVHDAGRYARRAVELFPTLAAWDRLTPFLSPASEALAERTD